MSEVREVYKRKPIKSIAVGAVQIPVFCEDSEYERNYEQIAADHIAALHRDGVNPFMETEFWNKCDDICLRFIDTYVQRNDPTLVDIGCGSGKLLSKISSANKYGVDISANYLAEALTSGASLIKSDIDDLPYLDSFFDCVICTDVLEHVMRLDDAVDELNRILKPGGMLIIRVPFREDLSSYLAHEYQYKYAHLRNFDQYSLRLFFEKIRGFSWIDYELGPHLLQRGYLKFLPQWPGVGLLMRGMLSPVRKISRALYERIVDTITEPVEITVVLRKK